MRNQGARSDLAFPIAIGGVGGSGTRVVADILSRLGYYLGGDLNQAKDNLWYTLLFKRRNILDTSEEQFERLARIFSSAMSGRRYQDFETFDMVEKFAAEERYGHSTHWLSERSTSLRERLLQGQSIRKWAWKEPNTHVLVERLGQHMPALRYIHVIRDGRDMAFSNKKSQLHYWAGKLFQMTDFNQDSPFAALRYWRLVNERIVRLRETKKIPILEVGFECLCERTTEQVLAIAKFCDQPISEEQAHDIGVQTVRTPPTVGRHRKMDLSTLDADDCRYASETKARLFRLLETTG